MRIYFAGSIRGGSRDRDIYFDLIQKLLAYGQVLTEHVGDPELTDSSEVNLSDEQIFHRDVSWIHEADFIVAEVTQPSLGVGYELGLSESLGKPIICLFRENEGRRLSAMIAGNPQLHAKEYRSVDEAVVLVSAFMRDNVP